MAANTYTRRLSQEDVETGSILVTKDRWRLFPPPMQEFVVEVGGQRFQTRIVAEECSCVPPPHQHYHLEAGHFRHLLIFAPKASVTFERVTGGAYRVSN